MKLLLVDNYDSFVYNLARYFKRLSVQVLVVRNDHSELLSEAMSADAIVISPGPCGPDQAGGSTELVQKLSGVKPILGICLGHQVICQAMGGTIIRAHRPIHGQAFPMELSRDSQLFQGIPSGTHFARYHSLIADSDTLPAVLRTTATCTLRDKRSGPEIREIMAVQHCTHLTFGVQFHPESILSHSGYQLLSNFLASSGAKVADRLPCLDLTATAADRFMQKPQNENPDEDFAVVLPT